MTEGGCTVYQDPMKSLCSSEILHHRINSILWFDSVKLYIWSDFSLKDIISDDKNWIKGMISVFWLQKWFLVTRKDFLPNKRILLVTGNNSKWHGKIFWFLRCCVVTSKFYIGIKVIEVDEIEKPTYFLQIRQKLKAELSNATLGPKRWLRNWGRPKK